MRRRRRTVMGIPTGRGRRRGSGSSLARVGAVGATALAAVPIAQRGVRAAGHVGDLAGRGQDLIGRGQDLVGKAGDAAGALGTMKEAVSSHSSTVGKAAGMVGAMARLSKDGKGGGSKTKLAHLIEEHTDIAVPRSVAYNQWTEMERFPSIVKGVDAVDQQRSDRAEWASKIGPVTRRWRARIVEQVPDERITWVSQSGPEHRGSVSFHSLDENLTRVMIQMHYVPHGPLETVANKLRIQRRRVRRDLRLFKHFMELRGEETGAWRGSIGEDRRKRRASRGEGRPGGRDSGPTGTGARTGGRGSGRSTGHTGGRGEGQAGTGNAARTGSRSSDRTGTRSRNGTHPNGSTANGSERHGPGSNGARRTREASK